MSNVKVAVNSKNDQVFTINTAPSSDGKTRGFFIVEQQVTSMEGGFISQSRRTATLTVEESIGKSLNWKAGQELPGKIVVSESHTPFYDGQEPKINPTTKEVVLVDGKKVYRQSRYTDKMDATDDLLASSTATVAVPTTVKSKAEQALN